MLCLWLQQFPRQFRIQTYKVLSTNVMTWKCFLAGNAQFHHLAKQIPLSLVVQKKKKKDWGGGSVAQWAWGLCWPAVMGCPWAGTSAQSSLPQNLVFAQENSHQVEGGEFCTSGAKSEKPQEGSDVQIILWLNLSSHVVRSKVAWAI